MRASMALVGLVISAAGAFAFAAPWQAHDAAALLREQRAAIEKLALLDGEWRGAAWSLLPDGTRHEITQTERCGPLLDGAIRTVEGRGYEPDGKTTFNAFAVLSFDPETKEYRMRSYAQGRAGDFKLELTATGFRWEIPAGPARIRYTATIEGDSWHEVGEHVVPGRDPQPIFEMTLARIGDTNWPLGTPVAPK